MLLGVNIDHIATLRQARYASMPDSPNAEPSVLEAAHAALRGGADSITIHVRGDRRHMQERDIFHVKEQVPLPINFEMGNTAEMLDMALRLAPAYVCMVPETREEITTEGGLDVVKHYNELLPTVHRLVENGIVVSMFINPEPDQVIATAKMYEQFPGTPVVELHTGCYANAEGTEKETELTRLAIATECAEKYGVRVNAGHGINYQNITALIRRIPSLHELNIGHTIVARALSVGMEQAVRDMRTMVNA